MVPSEDEKGTQRVAVSDENVAKPSYFNSNCHIVPLTVWSRDKLFWGDYERDHATAIWRRG